MRINCLSSEDHFNLHFKPESHLQPHIVSLLKVPTYVINQVLEVWNGFDPKITGCYTNKDGTWNKVIKDINENVLYESAGICSGQICQDENNAFVSK